MLKFVAIALLAASCSGIPVNDDGSSENVAKAYRIAAEEYFNVSYNTRIDYFESRKMKFFLYTNQAPYKVELKLDYLQQTLKNSSYDIERATRVLIHDRFSSEESYRELIAAYLRHFHKPVNVITVDYSYYAGVEDKTFMKLYQSIGETFALFVKDLYEYGTVGDKIHVVGFGAGAHIAAVAARRVAPYKFGRITGLCPAGMGFDENKSLPQLQRRDADFVDVIMTNMGEIGSSQPDRGHVTFYPHGGASQPTNNPMFLSHLKAYFYYVESVARGKVFVAYAADSYADYKLGKYDRTKVNYMGAYVKMNETGKFFLDVNPVPPYSSLVDPYNRPEKVKFSETYLSWVVATQSPWIYAPEGDLHYKNVATYQRTMLNTRDTTERYARQTVHYATEPRSNTYL